MTIRPALLADMQRAIAQQGDRIRRLNTRIEACGQVLHRAVADRCPDATAYAVADLQEAVRIADAGAVHLEHLESWTAELTNTERQLPKLSKGAGATRLAGASV